MIHELSKNADADHGSLKFEQLQNQSSLIQLQDVLSLHAVKDAEKTDHLVVS